MTKESKIISGVAVVFFALFVLLILNTNTGEAPVVTDSSLLLTDSSHMTGTKDANVNIVEFGDYQCPACAYAHPIVKQIIEAYKGNPNVNFVFRHFPLSMHKNAMIAAEAVEAAGAQGKFWEMHDMIYTGQNEWADSSKPLEIFVGYAQKLSLDIKAFSDSVNQKKFQSVIIKDRSNGQALGVDSTPTFFIGGERVKGILGFDDFKRKIDEKLQN